MNNLLKICVASTYLQNMLEDSDKNESNISNLLIKTHELLKLNITYEQSIKYLINLINNYKNITFTNENILSYVILSDYFMLNVQNSFFEYIIKKYILHLNKFYNELYTYNPINYYLIDIIGKYNVRNEIFKNIFEINKDICNLIISIKSNNVEQQILNKCTNIVKLNINGNTKITDVNNLQKLEELDISCGCDVNQKGILNLKYVKKLNACNNVNINDVNHLQQLEELNVSSDCGVGQKGISNLKHIKILDAHMNNKIYNVNHLQLLENLNISSYYTMHYYESNYYRCGVEQRGIITLKHIKILNVENNKLINDVSHLEQLKKLNMLNSGINVNEPHKYRYLTNTRF